MKKIFIFLTVILEFYSYAEPNISKTSSTKIVDGLASSQSTPNVKCGPNEIFNGKSCVAKSGEVWVETASRCPAGTVAQPPAFQCVKAPCLNIRCVKTSICLAVACPSLPPNPNCRVVKEGSVDANGCKICPEISCSAPKSCDTVADCFHVCPNGLKESHCDVNCRPVAAARCLGKTDCGCPALGSNQLDLCIRAGGTYDKERCNPKPKGPYNMSVLLSYHLNETSRELLARNGDVALKGTIRQISVSPQNLRKDPTVICPAVAETTISILLYQNVPYLVSAAGGEFSSATLWPQRCGLAYVGQLLVRPVEGYFRGGSGRCYSVSSMSAVIPPQDAVGGESLLPYHNTFKGSVTFNVLEASSSNCH